MRIYQISLINNYSDYKTGFGARGKPITLDYVVEKRGHLLPERVLREAKRWLALGVKELPSLLEIHRSIYSPLLGYKTLEDLKASKEFPEFDGISSKVVFERDSRYTKEFKERTDENFTLKIIQEYWANLKTKEEIACQLGMHNRNSLEWALKQINFISFPLNYKTLLNSSDSEGNKLIASKTTAWNALHPDLMRSKNKRAAQGCKTKEYRKSQSERIKEYDKVHPERKEKISCSMKEAWARCPEIRDALSEFAANDSAYLGSIIKKRLAGKKLSANEEIISKGFFKRFWQAHPELKAIYAEAKKKK